MTEITVTIMSSLRSGLESLRDPNRTIGHLFFNCACNMCRGA